jgi:hypothetical protein
MVDWSITFLITGFGVATNEQRGRVVFSPPAQSGSTEASTLRESAKFSGFPFPPERFARATVVQQAEDHRTAAKACLFEIDRTLDTLVFTAFGRAKYLPVGYASGQAIVPLAFSETHAPMPIASELRQPTMPSPDSWVATAFLKHTEHLLTKPPTLFSESELALAAGLRWMRLGSLARTFSESVTVAFVMEWLALEAMLLTRPEERLTDALQRIPLLMRHWPTAISMNYTPSLRAEDLVANVVEWKAVVEHMGNERKEMFHGREFHVSADPAAPPSWERGAKSFSSLEAVLGRCVAFLGKMSRERPTLRGVWGAAGDYVPSDDDCPPTNLGGWTKVWM